MEQWDAIREMARAKRKALAHLTGNGTAGELLKAAAESTNITPTPVRAGDSLLAGAEAVLDPDAQAIWFNREVDAELAVVYQIHEYAHFWIDGARASCTADDLYVEAPMESTATGIDRVQGYSPKERRERQANVFALEFLLPTPSLRQWFAEDHRDSMVIAQKIGVPEGIVFRQLEYALLIPAESGLSATPMVIRHADDLKLDPSQTEAAHAARGPLLVDAGPGTGKTRTLVGRAIFLINEQKVDPSSILALTFSNKAADEIRERVAGVIPSAAPHIWTGTFHSFGLELLRKYSDRLGWTGEPQVLDPVAALFFLEESLPLLRLEYYQNLYEPLYDLRSILQAISRAKDELVGPPAYLALAQQMRDRATEDKEIEIAQKALEVARVYAFYQDYLEREHLFDFGDLIWRSADLLDHHPDVRAEVQKTYLQTLVDEYQDVNRASAILLKQIAGSGEGLWVVGDVRQSIYRFRGAAPRNVRLFEKDFPGGETKLLKRNYRSQPKVVRAFSTLAPVMKAVRGAPFESWQVDRPEEGGHVLMEIADDPTAEAVGIAREIERQHAKGIRYQDQAVLCRSHSQLARIAVVLEREGVPILYLGDLFERPEIRDLLSLVELTAEPDGRGLLRVARFREYAIPEADAIALLHFAHEQQVPFPRALSLAHTVTTITDRGKTGLALLERHLDGISYGTSAWSLLANYLFQRSGYLQTLLPESTHAGQQQRLAIYQFMQFVDEQSRAYQNDADSKQKLLGYIRRLEVFGEEKQLREVPESATRLDAVRLLTVHASKGLEFRAVYLPVLGQGYFPARSQGQRCPPPEGMIADTEEDEHTEEEECLFFVALSRARDVLCLSRAQRYGKLNSKPSSLVLSISGALPRPPDSKVTWEKSDAAPDEPGREAPAPELAQDFEAEELDHYTKCPLSYYYEYVIGLKGRRVPSAYVQFHRCVYDVVRWADNVIAAGGTMDEQAVRDRLAAVWPTLGPVGHAFEGIYRQNAEAMILRAVTGTPAALRMEKPAQREKRLHYGRVRFAPDRVRIQDNGKRVLQRIRTGKIRSDEVREKDIYALYLTAAQSDPSALPEIEIMSLSTGDVQQVTLSEKVLNGKLENYDAAMRGILLHAFEPKFSDRECPRCPNYFICTSTDRA